MKFKTENEFVEYCKNNKLLSIKNDYTLEHDYLAAITENGIWIKDVVESKSMIINANGLDENFLVKYNI